MVAAGASGLGDVGPVLPIGVVELLVDRDKCLPVHLVVEVAQIRGSSASRTMQSRGDAVRRRCAARSASG